MDVYANSDSGNDALDGLTVQTAVRTLGRAAEIMSDSYRGAMRLHLDGSAAFSTAASEWYAPRAGGLGSTPVELMGTWWSPDGYGTRTVIGVGPDWIEWDGPSLGSDEMAQYAARVRFTDGPASGAHFTITTNGGIRFNVAFAWLNAASPPTVGNHFVVERPKTYIDTTSQCALRGGPIISDGIMWRQPTGSGLIIATEFTFRGGGGFVPNSGRVRVHSGGRLGSVGITWGVDFHNRHPGAIPQPWVGWLQNSGDLDVSQGGAVCGSGHFRSFDMIVDSGGSVVLYDASVAINNVQLSGGDLKLRGNAERTKVKWGGVGAGSKGSYTLYNVEVIPTGTDTGIAVPPETDCTLYNVTGSGAQYGVHVWQGGRLSDNPAAASSVTGSSAAILLGATPMTWAQFHAFSQNGQTAAIVRGAE